MATAVTDFQPQNGLSVSDSSRTASRSPSPIPSLTVSGGAVEPMTLTVPSANMVGVPTLNGFGFMLGGRDVASTAFID